MFAHYASQFEFDLLRGVQFAVGNIKHDAFTAQSLGKLGSGSYILWTELFGGKTGGGAALAGGQIDGNDFVTRHSMLGQKHTAGQLGIASVGSDGHDGFTHVVHSCH